MTAADSLGVYIHIPFCLRKCPYCDFCSIGYDPGMADAYTEAICQEMREAETSGRPAATVYLGGGTPPTLGGERLARILAQVSRIHEVDPAAEITVEANPGVLDEALVDALLAAGVNRLSLGVQSFHPSTLTALERIHGPEEAWAAAEMAARFCTWSLDLMFGVMGQSPEEAETDAERALSTSTPHVAAYCLTVEEGTALQERVARGGVDLPSPELQREMFDAVGGALEAGGLERYEVSNFARPGHESRHNRAYWLGREYVGYGAAAHSCLGSQRSWNVADPREYIERIARGRSPSNGREVRTPRARFLEALMLRLRTREGVELDGICGLADAAGETGFRERLGRQLELGLVCEAGGRLRLTPAGLPLADSVILALA
ncbi:MAG: radical SAM family heme chaperone HemW [Armatimonadia bacterium]|nr:radical SAM family heme chaperone HemW [Armatimonadia bacterium]